MLGVKPQVCGRFMDKSVDLNLNKPDHFAGQVRCVKKIFLQLVLKDH